MWAPAAGIIMTYKNSAGQEFNWGVVVRNVPYNRQRLVAKRRVHQPAEVEFRRRHYLRLPLREHLDMSRFGVALCAPARRTCGSRSRPTAAPCRCSAGAGPVERGLHPRGSEASGADLSPHQEQLRSLVSVGASSSAAWTSGRTARHLSLRTSRTGRPSIRDRRPCSRSSTSTCGFARRRHRPATPGSRTSASR